MFLSDEGKNSAGPKGLEIQAIVPEVMMSRMAGGAFFLNASPRAEIPTHTDRYSGLSAGANRIRQALSCLPPTSINLSAIRVVATYDRRLSAEKVGLFRSIRNCGHGIIGWRGRRDNGMSNPHLN